MFLQAHSAISKKGVSVMALNFFQSPLWELIEQSDWVSKYIVLLGLFILSICCIAIIILKYTTLRNHRVSLSSLKNQLRTSPTLATCIGLAKKDNESLGSKLIASILDELKAILEEKKANNPDAHTLDSQDFDFLENTAAQKIEALLLEQELYMPVLSTAAAAGPLVGLFGTIWGLINAFVRISKERSADIATVAPGIAEALVTTLAGLIVAIPALVAYNYFANQIRLLENDLLVTSDQVIMLIKKSQRS